MKTKASNYFPSSIFKNAIIENVKYIKEEEDCNWITTDSGAHICIGGDGEIKKGPEGMVISY